MTTCRDTRLLVVEDDRGVRETLIDVLEEFGYHVDGAEDGPLALDLAKTTSYDIALLDYRMPGMSGVDVADHLAVLAPACHTIMISGYADLETRRHAAEVGIHRVLSKPVNIRQLLGLLEQLG